MPVPEVTAPLAAEPTSRAYFAKTLAEDAALRSLQSDDDGHPVIDSFDVPEAWGRALAAALGDDLLLRVENGDSSGGFWRHLDPELPTLALPAGVEPLSGHLDVPEILRRRLQSVGVCPDSETASRLQPGLAQGQRLVTQDGGLWRDRGDMTIVLVEQYFEFARDLADRFIVLDRGEVVAKGTRAEMNEADVRQHLTV